MDSLAKEVSAIDTLCYTYDSAPVQKAKRPKRKMRHYERQRTQKNELEQQIASLSEVLQHEQAKKKTKGGISPSRYTLPSVTGRLEARLAAEEQKKWLQAAILGNIKLIDDLKTVVRQHMDIASLIAAASPEDGSKLFNQPSDDLLYSMDIQDINDLYAQTDLVFGTCSSELEPERSDFSRTETAGPTGVSVRLARKQLIDREEFEAFDDLETTQAVKFRTTRRFPGGELASLKHRVTMRRFVEEDRVVFVFKSFVAGERPSSLDSPSSATNLSGLQTDITGWIAIQPSSTGHGAVVRLCVQQVPLHLNSPMPEPSLQQFNGMLRSAIHESNEEIFTAAEALLL